MTRDRGLKKKEELPPPTFYDSKLLTFAPFGTQVCESDYALSAVQFSFCNDEVNYIVFQHKCSGISDELNQLDSSSDGRKF